MVRRAEDEAAWRALGRVPDRHEWLGLPDGGVADVPFDELVAAVARILEVEEPAVVVTFGPDGIFGHPDHIAIGLCEHKSQLDVMSDDPTTPSSGSGASGGSGTRSPGRARCTDALRPLRRPRLTFPVDFAHVDHIPPRGRLRCATPLSGCDEGDSREEDAIMSAEHKPGDVVKGKVLTPTGEWVPLANLYSLDSPGTANASGSRTTQRGRPSLGRKWAMGFVWVVLAGWLGMGTVFGLATIALGFAVGGLPQGSQYISDVLGIVLGAWWYVSWLSRKQAHLSR